MKFRRFVYSTRGLYLFGALVAILWIKHRTESRIGFSLYLVLLAVVLAAQLFRTWAAGYVGTTARARDPHTEALLTAGPYAHVRNPMYLGGLIIITAYAMMSGLWYGPLIAWAVYAFVYSNVIPYEEAYLRERFGAEYLAYYRAVPRLLPTRRGYAERHGVFRLREALANEMAAWAGTAVLSTLFYVL